MNTDFFRQKKKQRYLILVFVATLVITLIVVWRGVFIKESTPTPFVAVPLKKTIKINTEILTDPRLLELEPFEEIPPLTEGIGRENPFVPY